MSVLLVCMGNICRSPMAEGVLRHRLAALAAAGADLPVRVDSAGTHGYHSGAPPDPRAQAAAARRGIDISGLRAREVTSADLAEFDLLLAMDGDNLAGLEALAAPIPGHAGKLRLLLDFAPGSARNVPDPYYGGVAGFERVLDLVESAMDGLLADLAERVRARRPAPSD